jgi:hypothetical protein
MWRCVDLVLTNVSEERIASIFRVEKFSNGEPATCSCWLLDEDHKENTGMLIYFN